MRYFVFIFICTLAISLVSCFPVQNVAREFSSDKKNKLVILNPPSKEDIFLLYYPLDPYQYDLYDYVYDVDDSQFLSNISDSIVINLFMRGLTERLDQYNIRYIVPDSRNITLRENERAYFYSVAQVEMLEYVDTTVVKSDSIYVVMPGDNYALVYSLSEWSSIEFADTVEIVDEVEDIKLAREFARNNIEANTWLEFFELGEEEKSMEVLFSNQYTSDFFNGYFKVDYPRIEIKFVPQEYKIFINDVLDLIYFSGYKNGEYIADHIFNLYLTERLGRERIDQYYKYDPYTNRARRTNDDRFIIIDP